jgi:hypothetical protein
MSSTSGFGELKPPVFKPAPGRSAGQGSIFIGIVALCLLGLFLRMRLEESSTARVGSRPSAAPTWKVAQCSVVRDDRIAEGQSAELVLLGPSTIHATVWDTQCRIPAGTEFHRDGDFMCNPSVAGPYDSGCFGIRSETGR